MFSLGARLEADHAESLVASRTSAPAGRGVEGFDVGIRLKDPGDRFLVAYHVVKRDAFRGLGRYDGAAYVLAGQESFRDQNEKEDRQDEDDAGEDHHLADTGKRPLQPLLVPGEHEVEILFRKLIGPAVMNFGLMLEEAARKHRSQRQ